MATADNHGEIPKLMMLQEIANCHDGGRCAAYSQVWLLASLIGKAGPKRKLNFDNNPMMAMIQEQAGQRTAQAFQSNGMSFSKQTTTRTLIPGAEHVLLINCFNFVESPEICPGGGNYYYVTIKYRDGGMHANAFWKGNGEIVYLEPNIGLIACPCKLDSFAPSMNQLYNEKGFNKTIVEFKIYGPIKLQGR